MYLVKVTAKREGNKLTKVSEQVIAEIADEPNFMRPAASLLYDAMVRDGIIPSMKKDREAAG
jgi:hypothetical protein